MTTGGKTLGLKIDVDTYVGMEKGVPRLLDSLRRLGVPATFYLSVGPDASGLAVLQMIRNPKFLAKMVRTKAPALYGWRTALYGTLLPSPKIALSFPDLVRRIADEGHEVQFHAWDHRRWQDSLSRKSEAWIRAWFDEGMNAFAALTGHGPTSFGAPAWRIDARVLAALKGYPSLQYLSCTRAQAPFVHEGLGLPEVPSDLPCFEEIGDDDKIGVLLERLQSGGTHVLPVHAEVEGGIWAAPFEELMEKALASGYRVMTLGQIAAGLDRTALPVRKFEMTLLPGRSVACCV